MIDLNTVLNTALTQALNEALKPLLERIAQLEASTRALDAWSATAGSHLTERLTTLEARVMATTDSGRLDAICHRLEILEAREGTVEDLEHTIDERIGTYLEHDDLTSRINADELDLSRAIEETLESMDLTDAIAEAVRDLLADARITLI
jgi:hypothetical protein